LLGNLVTRRTFAAQSPEVPELRSKCSIRVEFSISDLNLMNNGVDDNAMYEDESADTSEATQSGSKSGKDNRSSNEQDEDDEYLDEDNAPDTSFPAHLSIAIEKVCGHFQSRRIVGGKPN